MGLFDKITGKGDGDKPKGGNQRAHERHPAQGERVTMLNNGKATDQGYELVDISEGGFCLGGYEGKMRSGQYFEFRLTGAPDKGAPEAEGFAEIVRVFDTKAACKFPPQPRLKKFLRDYLD